MHAAECGLAVVGSAGVLVVAILGCSHAEPRLAAFVAAAGVLVVAAAAVGQSQQLAERELRIAEADVTVILLERSARRLFG
jgi:hypothetical protein